LQILYLRISSLSIPHNTGNDPRVAAEIGLLLLTSVSLSWSDLLSAILLLLWLSLDLGIPNGLLDLLLDQPLLVDVRFIGGIVRIFDSDELVAV
jgi:hypothetical protein